VSNTALQNRAAIMHIVTMTPPASALRFSSTSQACLVLEKERVRWSSAHHRPHPQA
jgi:hypothetical protein